MRNAKKFYRENSIYHVYNRCINAEQLFINSKSGELFCYLLSRYLCRAKSSVTNRGTKNYHQRLQLLAFCLMDNHFHLLLFQRDSTTMKEFMQSLAISLTYYTNLTQHRIGHLLQGVYKARLVKSDEDLINMSKYIHLNPCGKDLHNRGLALNYLFSSVSSYLPIGRTTWKFVDTKAILTHFKGDKREYEEFLLSIDSGNLGV